ncbi:response regulator transcription factor [Streptomyces sp. S465]|uniref:response regulator transcription factor n=1 Tax=Streptomyces sp. S465 TaxID=2979468 RepID=UPI0022A865B2|nr:response regulator transcription factor [Streptomyces sp. S465]WAP57404.1 response regulator transcription factor [Streptomyces sp. S465]
MHETARILVVDDEPSVREALGRALRYEGYDVGAAQAGPEALEAIERERPHLVLLAVATRATPGPDGPSVARRIRSRGCTVPILMVGDRDSLSDRVAGLDSGADDYLTGPFAQEELLARVRALLRRGLRWRPVPAGKPPLEPAALAFEDMTLDPLTRRVTRSGRRLDLTKTEFALLKLFLSRPRQVLSRAAILRDVWGFEFEPSSNTLDVYVMYLRRKTEAAGEPRLVHTVRGVGYVLRAVGADEAAGTRKRGEGPALTPLP